MKQRRKGATLDLAKIGKADVRATQHTLITHREEVAWLEANRPKTRGDCEEGERPCPFISCKYHLYLDVNPETGSIKLNFPDIELDELDQTCALDVADLGGITLEETGEYMNLTRERINQIEEIGLRHFTHSARITLDKDGYDVIPDQLTLLILAKEKIRKETKNITDNPETSGSDDYNLSFFDDLDF